MDVLRTSTILISDEVSSDRLKTLLAYWHEKRSGNPRPRLTDIDLMDIYAIAPYAVIRDVIDEGEKFHCRFFGTGMVEMLGYDATGTSPDDLHEGPAIQSAIDVLRTVYRECRAVQSSGTVYWVENKEFISYRSLYLPLDDQDGRPNHLIGVYDFEGS